MVELTDKTVIVTGAAGGIGAACVRVFADAGAKVMMNDVDDAGYRLADEIGPDRCRFTAGDVSDEPSVRHLIEETLEAFGSLDVLLNNAAVLLPVAPVHETTVEQFNTLMAVNVRGVFLCCKHAHSHLKKSRGCIVNISSMVGICGEKHHAVYSATKGAINALTMSMAVDYGQEGIRCNAICPSSVLTPNSDKIVQSSPNPEATVELRKKINAIGFTADPGNIASVALFLASPASAFMTGAIVPVSGGCECGYGLKY